MLKLLSLTLLLGSILSASTTNSDIEKFLKKTFSRNPSIVSMDVKVKQKLELKKPKGWSAYVVSLKAKVKTKAKEREIKQNMVWFSDGQVITENFMDLKTGKSIKDTDLNFYKEEYCKKENLIYGNTDAKHKVMIFSDPLCPYCRRSVPKALKYMIKKPDEYAIYYYHFPLLAIHPASDTLVKAAVVAQKMGKKDVILKLYNVKVKAREKDTKKILSAFNKVMGTNVKESDIKAKDVINTVDADVDIASSMMVGGTPTMYLDGKKENITKYK